jgi:hypothetical protein
VYVALQARGDTWVRSFAHQLYSVCKWSAGPFLQEKIVIVTYYTLGCRFIRLVFGKCGVPLLSVQAAVCMAVKSRAALPKTLPSKVCSSMLHTDSNCTLTAGIMAPAKLDTLLRQLHLQTMTDYQRKALVATLAPLALLTCEQVNTPGPVKNRSELRRARSHKAQPSICAHTHAHTNTETKALLPQVALLIETFSPGSERVAAAALLYSRAADSAVAGLTALEAALGARDSLGWRQTLGWYCNYHWNAPTGWLPVRMNESCTLLCYLEDCAPNPIRTRLSALRTCTLLCLSAGC